MEKEILNRPNTYLMIPRVLAFIEKDAEVLLIERAKKDAFAYSKLNGIGGHIEKGEDPLSAIRREVKEEAGLDIQVFQLNVIISIDIEAQKGICVFAFSAEYNQGIVRSSEEGRLVWKKENELNDQNILSDVPILLKMVKESKQDGKIKYLQYSYIDQELCIKHIK